MSDTTSFLPQVITKYFGQVPQAETGVAPGDVPLGDVPLGDVYADQVRRHLEVAQRRQPGESCIDVATDAGSIEIVVVNDDMPLLVEAVLATVEAHDLTVGRMDHPVMPVLRDAEGALIDVVDADGAAWESWIYVGAIAGHPDIDLDVLRADLREVIGRVADVDRDTSVMRARMSSCASDLGIAPVRESIGIRAVDRFEYARLLEWFAGHQFLPLGYRRVGAEGEAPGTVDERLGVWRTDAVDAHFPSVTTAPLLPRVSRVYVETGIQRSNFPVLLQIPAFDGHGNYDGEHRFLGSFTTSGLHQTILDVPVLRTKVSTVLLEAGVDEDSFAGQAMIELLQNYPLAEMFASTDEELGRRCAEMLDAVATRSLRLFLRVHPAGQTAVALIYIPRDRYNTASRLALEEALVEQLHGTSLEYTARVSEMPLALLQVLVRVDEHTAAELGSLDTGSDLHSRMQAALVESIRSWDERVREIAGAADESNSELLHVLPALSEDYKDQRSPADAVADLRHIVGLAPGEMTVTLQSDDERDDRWTFTLYLCDGSATLTDVLPVLHSLGVDVLDEHPYNLRRPDGIDCWAYEFSVALTSGMSLDIDSGLDESAAADEVEQRFTDAFRELWHGGAEVDAFNELILRCGLDWREAAILRAYYRYLRQCGFAYSTAHTASVLGGERAITRGFIGLFEASFDPAVADDGRRSSIESTLRQNIGAVIGLDADRIVSAFASVILATARTNCFVTPEGAGSTGPARSVAGADAGAAHLPVMSFKLRPRDIPLAPEPRPLHEIFVYSPRVEGVHLRFGMVARGGLRWSDRREDFRTEILGLVKAQAVKNAVIVPLGAKGGFIVKQPPVPTGDAGADREAQRAEGIACYRQFIAGLLDVTDNIDRQSGAVIPARSVVRRDGDDTYLVVAADKGTAAFSDIANDVAAQYDFWLGDAFASGGSAGYDHKAMGITARGAWEAVKRHFREMGIDTQSQDFTVAGIGDMSGDVFGNGMLLSEHIRLVAAFDHRHVFIDPTPDAASSFAERRRLFDLPRSSWADYDAGLISPGGGVWSREQKSIPISPEMRSALGLDDSVTELSPPELIHAVLLAPVDLLWNGGIGTYIKASTESDAEVGDKANDAIRVNGDAVRAKVVGEGGNLGVTERGRIEFDLSGGRINTDAMDNSAGVDCSDHEVNIKIVLGAVVSTGELPAAQRNPLLESMTDEVSALVLADNISQNSELGFSRQYANERVDVHARMLAELAARGVDLELEALPTPAALRKRLNSEYHRGLTSPELATLMAQVKLAAKSDLLASDLPDNDVFDGRLSRYFPTPLREAYPGTISTHRLRREIVTTTLVNDVVDKAGVTHLFRLGEGSGVSVEEGVRAYVVANKAFGMAELFDRITHAPVDVAMVDEMMLYTRRLLFRASRWLLAFRPQPLAMGAEMTRYTDRVTELSAVVAQWFGPTSAADVDERAAKYRSRGVPADLAHDVAISLHRFCLLDIIDAAEIADRDPAEVGELYFAAMEHFGLEELLTAVSDLEYGDRWHSLARLALRDDMHGALRAVTLKILEVSEPEESTGDKIREWEQSQASRLSRVRTMLGQIEESGTLDLATLSVAARQLRSLIR